MAINDKRKGEAPSEFMSQVAAVSWAETQQPETRLAIQSARKTRFFSANQVEVFCLRSSAMAKRKDNFYSENREKGNSLGVQEPGEFVGKIVWGHNQTQTQDP